MSVVTTSVLGFCCEPRGTTLCATRDRETWITWPTVDEGKKFTNMAFAEYHSCICSCDLSSPWTALNLGPWISLPCFSNNKKEATWKSCENLVSQLISVFLCRHRRLAGSMQLLFFSVSLLLCRVHSGRLPRTHVGHLSGPIVGLCPAVLQAKFWLPNLYLTLWCGSQQDLTQSRQRIASHNP